MSNKLSQWQMVELNKDFKLIESILPEVHPGEALVKIAGCGVCHTDLSFWHSGVQTKQAMPLTLVVGQKKHRLKQRIMQRQGGLTVPRSSQQY